MKKHLIIGHSHVGCIEAYLRDNPQDKIAIVNLVKSDIYSEGFVWPMEPDVVSMMLAGNQHNIYGLFEHPIPFSISTLPNDDPVGQDRVVIPYNVFYLFFESISSVVKKLVHDIKSAFPDAKHQIVASPPPLETVDVDKISDMAKSLVEHAHLGVTHPEVRMKLYDPTSPPS